MRDRPRLKSPAGPGPVYLIHQSIQGNHVLFDLNTLRPILVQAQRPLSTEDCYSVEHHIERMIEQPSLDDKRAYLDSLDARTYAWVVRTYFAIIEDNLLQSSDSQERFH